MKKILLLTFFSLLLRQGIAQNLSEKLWNRVQNCHSYFEDYNDDGILDFDKIDDSKNGYLKIMGSWPTCGCFCSSTIGAYKNSKGEYTFLQKETYSCSFKKEILSNKNIKTILPDDFDINNFRDKSQDSFSEYASFFLDFKIPRYGTDTKVQLKLIPFGIFVESDEPIVFSYSGANISDYGAASHVKSLNRLRAMISDFSSEESLTFILSREFKKINEEDRRKIEELIDDDSWDKFPSIEFIADKLLILKNTYDIYKSLKYTSLVLGWNRETSKFHIKSKSSKPKKLTFKEFILDGKYWALIC